MTLTPSVRLGRVLGIPIGLHASWFVVFVLVTLSLGRELAGRFPGWSPSLAYGAGAATAVLFFASVVAHELGHSAVALRVGVPVRAITLFIFGGVAEIGREPSRPRDEVLIALAGPAVSVALGGALYLVAAVPGMPPLVAGPAAWLGRINVALAVFNLIPGFPLDGGRVLRGILWARSGQRARATVLTATIGKGVAYLFIVLGVWSALMVNLASGLWTAFIGWFLLQAAQTSASQAVIAQALAGVTARDVMTTDCPRVHPDVDLATFVERYVLGTGQRCHLVTLGDLLVGIVTVHQVREVPRVRWALTPVGAIARPLDQMHRVAPDTPVLEVLALMDERDVAQVPVTANGYLLGLVGREHVLKVIRLRLELGEATDLRPDRSSDPASHENALPHPA